MKLEQKNVSRSTDVKGNSNLILLQNEQFVNTKDTILILGIKSQTTIGKYDTEVKNYT